MQVQNFDIVVSKGDNDNVWGIIHYGDDLLTTVGKNIKELKANFNEQFEDFYQLDRKKISYKVLYELSTFFEQFDFLNLAAIARKAGINDALMRQYKAGIKYPSEKQVSKIEVAIHELLNEVKDVHLVATR